MISMHGKVAASGTYEAASQPEPAGARSLDCFDKLGRAVRKTTLC
jgi:hypothetical protein